jgi:hypothetical protein
MLYSVRQQLRGLAYQRKLLPARAHAPWQLCVAWVSMLTLLVVLLAAAGHQHRAVALDDENCIVCDLAFDSMDDIPAAPVVADMAAVFNFYYLLISEQPSRVDVFHPLSPPSCGPPLLTA